MRVQRKVVGAIPERAAATAASWQEGRRAATHSLAIGAPLVLFWVLLVAFRENALVFDFHHAYLPAARHLLDGDSPYPSAAAAALAPKTAFVYPPLTAFLAIPFVALPPLVTDVLVSMLAIACVVLILRLLHVRDWRCYMIVFLWVPTHLAVQTGNVSLLIALGLALIWRYRDRAGVVALVAGALVALKLFLWPLLLWLVATRRYRAAAGGVLAGFFLVFAPWAAIGFAGLAQYPHLLSIVSRLQRLDGYTIAAVLEPAFTWPVAYWLGVVAGLAVLTFAVASARGDSRNSFALMIAGILLLSPVVWSHYFVVLLVVVGIYAPRFGPIWAAPLVFWISPHVGNATEWETVLALVGAGTIWFFAVGGRPREGPALVRPHVSVPATRGLP